MILSDISLDNILMLVGILALSIFGIWVAWNLAMGWRDFARISPKRIWAIGSVCFRESMRRRVLWITPLAMLGIIAVSQLSLPSDEEDAIRQTTKYCLFASGIVVVIATLILACTSLPKEIDNRVIYTIVTKPTTRLEIVLGKTLGFARTSAAILLVMGLFSYVYLQINAAQLNSAIRGKLANLPSSDQGRQTLEHYADEGLLQARTYSRPVLGDWGTAPGLQIYAKTPSASDKYTWIFGSSEQNVMFPFELPQVIFDHPEVNLIFEVHIACKQWRPLTRREIEFEAPDPTATTRPTTQGIEKRPGPASITATVLNENGFTALTSKSVMDRIHTKDTQTREPDPYANANRVALEPPTSNGVGNALLVIQSKEILERIATLPAAPDGKRRIFLSITGVSPATLYGFDADAVTLTAQTLDSAGKAINLPIPSTDSSGKPLPRIFRGRTSNSRQQQLRGDPDRDESPVGIFEFRQKDFQPVGKTVSFELRIQVERSGVEATEAENGTRVEVVVVNHKSGFTAPPLNVITDSDRPTFFNIPREAVEGGDFDLQIRCRTDGNFVGLRPSSVVVASSRQSFAFNLVKSLFILWLLSVLVVIISVFCSTFVSWPIAVVLAVVLLMGRWCVVQLGEMNTPQQIFTDFFGSNASPVTGRIFTDTVGALNKLLALAAKVLPDLDQFRVTEDIERGVTIPWQSLTDPLLVIVTFGLPMLILGYVFLRQKEVAP
jgi:hypothetical protein